MTTTEQLRCPSNFHPVEFLHHVADELDQRDDTIAQLRAERDYFRELLRRCEWTSNGERIRCAFCDAPITEGHRGHCVLESALKGTK